MAKEIAFFEKYAARKNAGRPEIVTESEPTNSIGDFLALVDANIQPSELPLEETTNTLRSVPPIYRLTDHFYKGTDPAAS